MYKYLDNKNFQDKISTLAQKYRNKKILMYGAGLLFNVIKEKFDISKLNIVAITDIKFDQHCEYRGLRAIPPSSIKDLSFDVIIIAVYNPDNIKQYFKNTLFFEDTKYKIDCFNTLTAEEKYSWGKIKESMLAHKYLDGLKGIEIGGSAHNDFGLNTINIDFCDDNTDFKLYEIETVGYAKKVDVVAEGDNLPFDDNSWDFVISSHVLEHFWDPIKTLKEWMRVIKPEGYIFMIIPHKERTFDKNRKRTQLSELIERKNRPDPKTHSHHNVWITQDVLEICEYLKFSLIEFQDIDDKVGNGFTIVIKK
ncbi:MAG: methyltransferase domain-containing protein [Candidatus Gastranaerophilaceae bacterium]|jgi:predicted SAM-dependent methyltransferase